MRLTLTISFILGVLCFGCTEETDVAELGDESFDSVEAELRESKAGEKLTTTTGVNFRTGPSTSAGIIRVLPEGTSVTSRGSAQGVFVPVSYQGTNGFIHGNYLLRASEGGTTLSYPWDGKHRDADDWARYTQQAIDTFGSALRSDTPGDISTFCPSYRSLSESKKEQFWIGLIASMAKFESNYDPTLSFTESFNDSSGKRVVSRGLLQLSIESAKGYDCEVPTATSLHDPKVNLTCSVRILNRWVDRDGVISGGSSGAWRGGARYWSVLRNNGPRLNSIRAMTRSLSICR